MVRWPRLAAAFLGTAKLQVGALQTQSSADLDEQAEAWSFSGLIDVLYSDDKRDVRAAHNRITSLCKANDLPHGVEHCDETLGSRVASSYNRGFVFALVAHVTGNSSFDTFAQAYGSIRHYHPGNSIIVVDNASPQSAPYDNYSAQILDLVSQDHNAVYAREDTSGFEIGGYARALKVARKRGWSVRGGWVFLQATTMLLQPLPLDSLPCKISSFIEMGGPSPPCDLPKFNRENYEVVRTHPSYMSPTEWFNQMTIHEFRRLKYEFPLWDQYEKLVCGRGGGRSAMHNMFIATAEGSSGLEDLGFFSLRLEKKEDSNFVEGFNGVFLAALDSATDSADLSCFIDKERLLVGQHKGSGPGTFIHKQHGGSKGFFASFLGFIHAVDANRDTFVDDAEIADAKANRPVQFGSALGNLCNTMAQEDPFQNALGCSQSAANFE